MGMIKFRVWCKEGPSMLDWGYLLSEPDLPQFMKHAAEEDAYYSPLMQFTGLTDKNGVEIYEGDVMRIPELYETPENTTATYYNEQIIYGYGAFLLGEDSPIYEDAEYISAECEVIGNIYENPELIEEAADE